ncbi:perilipin-5-like [Uloborus diversus]|uniref:perilipin-5-like n=1 Tax=Uloborus diversus TaxID=327109 RepID=UPI002409D843|nr:perilipin-5-like [Uloborus diversus]
MTKPEEVFVSQNVGQEDAVAEKVMKSEFLERVSEIPAVNVAKEYSTAAYDKVKQMNRFTAAALSIAETTALYFAVTAKPFLEKVQPQAQLVDHLACRGLEAVEEKIPFLMKPPEQLVEDARKLCSTTVEMGYQKVDEIKSMGSETLNNVKNYGLQKANEALTGTEELVDKYLPPAFGEGSPEAAATEDGKSVPERASQLTSKIGLRVYGHGVKHLLVVHRMSQESVAKLIYTMELLQQLKQDYGNKTVQEYIDEAKVKATWIWDELNKEPAEASDDAQKSLEQRMLSLARRMTSVLVHAYSLTAIPLSALPQTYSEGVQAASRYATELFSQIDQASNAGEITTTILQGFQDKLTALQAVIQRLTSQTEEIEMEDLSESKSSDKLETEVKSESASS